MAARAIVGLLVAAVLTAACAGNGDNRSGPRGREATSTTRDVAADRAAAERAVLRLSDLPPGWQAEPHEESPDDPDLTRQLSECLGVDLSLLQGEANDASADSPDFESPDDEEVRSSVGVASTVAKARELFAVFERPETPGCLNDAVSRSMRATLEKPRPGQAVPPGVAFGQVSIQPTPFPVVGDRTVAFRVTVPVQALGLSVPRYADLVLSLRGRSVALLYFLDTRSPFPTDQAERLAKTVVERLPAS